MAPLTGEDRLSQTMFPTSVWAANLAT